MAPALARQRKSIEDDIYQSPSPENIQAGPSDWCFKICNWVPFTESLSTFQRAVSVLGPGAGEIYVRPLRVIFKFTISPLMLWAWVLLVLKAWCLAGTHLSDVSIKRWGAQRQIQTLCSSRWIFVFWIPSWLWVIIVGVGFMRRLCLSLSYLLQCGFCLTLQRGVVPPLGFLAFFKGNSSAYIYRFGVSLGWGEFRDLNQN